MVISVADAYRIDPATGQVDMDLFQQFANQQQAMFTPQGGTGSSMGNPNLTLGQQYMAGNPDVQQDAIRRANAEGLTGGDAFSNRLDEIALEHYNNFGRAEGRSGYGYSAPSSGSFLPSPNDIPSFGAGDRGRTNTPGANINPGNGQPFTPVPGQTGLGSMPGGNNQSQQPGFDNSGYQTALNNFGGLLSNYGDFFGGLLSGAQNAQANMPPQGQNYTGFYGPQQAATGFGGGFNNFGNFGGALSGGFSNGSTWGGGGNATSGGNTGHRQLWTT